MKEEKGKRRRGLPLFIVDTGQVPMHNGVIWAEAESPQIGSHCTVKYPSFLENIAEVDVGIQEGRV